MDTMVDGFVELENKLAALANAQFESPEYKRLFSLKWTRERARIYMVQRSYFVLNRRDCWAYLQGSVPFDVKQIIWDHEKEELTMILCLQSDIRKRSVRLSFPSMNCWPGNRRFVLHHPMSSEKMSTRYLS